MSRIDPTIDSFRTVVQNPFATVFMSLLYSIAGIPLFISVGDSVVLNMVVGLWTSSLLWGTFTIVNFEFASSLLDPVGITCYRQLAGDVQDQLSSGLIIGFLTFPIAIATAILFTNDLSGLIGRGMFISGIYLAITWVVVVYIAVTVHVSAPRSIFDAFRESVGIIFEYPRAVAWFTFEVVLLSLIAALTVVSVFLFLPATLVFLALLEVPNIPDSHFETETGLR